jgi:hypothetical protein
VVLPRVVLPAVACLAARYTLAANVSLLMLLETVLASAVGLDRGGRAAHGQQWRCWSAVSSWWGASRIYLLDPAAGGSALIVPHG